MRGFAERLQGGHPNSLGDTVAVVEEILANNELFDEFFNCYFSDDEVVRLRTSNGMKRICKANKSLLLPYLDRFLDEISQIDQASTQWTLSQLFEVLVSDMSAGQIKKATRLMKHNLANHNDWIVLNQTMVTLSQWAKKDENLKNWIIPQLQRHSADPRKSVSGRAIKLLNTLDS
ncbi:hypothetical protein SAMN04490243_2533 [Robiginitalea myxolifaciens]|uniref:HEAT repeat-containing protein n=1 Tax=Robiginitalea myxolifaciens TaxID=400055 RepID=A0A1I6HBP9_9FLAO|nr:hypothetical protein [Robiginitalea myxolifaciens]SFR51935.1 hypothetical protein SAMN04490243_2533 [Robiginitalea myxolifaciens]